MVLQVLKLQTLLLLDSITMMHQTLFGFAGGGSATDTSIYLNDGTLAANRTVTQNNNNLTFLQEQQKQL
jgi:hypothetical protein